MSFDLQTFVETSEPVGWDDLDFDLFDSEPLSPEILRSIRYMCDVEYHTSCYLRDLLVTPSHRDRKSTRLKLQSRGHLVCRLLLEKKKRAQTSAEVRSQHGNVHRGG